MVERQAMIRRESILPNSQTVLLGGITFVAVPAIVGILLVQTQHILISMSLGQHRGRGNVGILAVSLDNTLIGQATVRRETIAVDGQKLRL